VRDMLTGVESVVVGGQYQSPLAAWGAMPAMSQQAHITCQPRLVPSPIRDV